MKTLIEGVKIGVKLSLTPAFQAYESRLVEFPDCAHITKFTDKYWECMIRLYSVTIYHPIGESYLKQFDITKLKAICNIM